MLPRGLQNYTKSATYILNMGSTNLWIYTAYNVWFSILPGYDQSMNFVYLYGIWMFISAWCLDMIGLERDQTSDHYHRQCQRGRATRSPASELWWWGRCQSCRITWMSRNSCSWTNKSAETAGGSDTLLSVKSFSHPTSRMRNSSSSSVCVSQKSGSLWYKDRGGGVGKIWRWLHK